MAMHEEIGKSSEWYTPKYIFDALECDFDLDAAAPWDRSGLFVPTEHYISAHSLLEDWFGFVWLNPPFEGRNSKGPWLDKMRAHGNGIVLTPDRSSAPWWSAAAKVCTCHLQVYEKIKFIRPDGSLGEQPSTGTTLFGYGLQAVRALKNAERNNLGILLKRFNQQINSPQHEIRINQVLF